MKKIKAISMLLSAVILLGSLPVFASAKTAGGLEFGADGKFTVLQITDPQDDRYPAHELNRFIETALKTAQPDLVVFTGDIVEDSRAGDFSSDDEHLREGVCVEGKNGELDYAATLENVKAAVDAVFAPVEKAEIPFAVTLGNNDYNSGISNGDWLKIFATYPHCVTVDESDDEAGKIDSYVEIKKHNSSDAGFGVWLLDNGRSFTDGQAKWFAQRETSAVPSIVFEHCPTSDVGNLFERCNFWQSGAIASGIKSYRLNKEIANGVFFDPYEPGITSEQFTAWKNKGVVGAFFGHIHTDGYTGEWNGITLGLTYGCEFAKAGPYGFRTITLDESGSFITELFTYNKGVAALQTYEPYPIYENKAAEILGSFLNAFSFIFNSISALLKF